MAKPLSSWMRTSPPTGLILRCRRRKPSSAAGSRDRDWRQRRCQAEGRTQRIPRLGRKLIAAIREVSPEAVPEGATIPDPEVFKEGDDELASYSIPTEEEIVGKLLLPTVGLGKEIAVIALHRDTAKRLLEESELETVAEGLEASLEKPLAGAIAVRFQSAHGSVPRAIWPMLPKWVYSTRPRRRTPFSADEMKEQIELVLDFLRCYERSTSVTYVEDGATVTKSISVFSDYEADDK